MKKQAKGERLKVKGKKEKGENNPCNILITDRGDYEKTRISEG